MIAQIKTQTQTSGKTLAASTVKTAVAAQPAPFVATRWSWARLTAFGRSRSRAWANPAEARSFRTEVQARSAYDHLMTRKSC